MLLTNFKFVLVKIFTVFSHWQAAMIAYFLHTAIGILEAEPPVAFFFFNHSTYFSVQGAQHTYQTS